MKRKDMNSQKVDILGLKNKEVEYFLYLLDDLRNEDRRIKLSNSDSCKDFVAKLISCFEYETTIEIEERKSEYRTKYQKCKRNAEKYFENIKCFIDYNKKWKVQNWEGFSRMLIDMCATIDANENNASTDIEHLKCIEECVIEEVEGFNTDYERYSLVAFIAQQTVLATRRPTGKKKQEKSLKEYCNDFVVAYKTENFETFSYSIFNASLKSQVSKQLKEEKKFSIFEKAAQLIREGKMTEEDLLEISKDTEDLTD